MQRSGRDRWIIAIYCLLLLIGVVLTIAGVNEMNTETSSHTLLATGIICIVFVASVIPVVVLLIMHNRAAPSNMQDQLSAHLELLTQIHEHTMLSDSAKRIAYRRNEREMLRRAIEEDISHEDWDGATMLVDEMADKFGYREESEEFRKQIEMSRSDIVNKRIREAIDHLESKIATKDWTAAYAEAGRIRRLFPESPLATDLETRVKRAWSDYKHALERRFLEASGNGDIDDAMKLLKEMDAYLSPREAEPYQEVARGVISKARENLGVQFKMALQDNDWIAAVKVGDDIVAEFPNTLMAREVLERIDVLRSRAAALQTDTSTASPAAPAPAATPQTPIPIAEPKTKPTTD